MPGLMTAPGARTPLKDSPDALRLQAAHDLNYRFNHSIDAKSRASDCASCHEARTFCVECHRSEGVMNTGRGEADVAFRGGVRDDRRRHRRRAPRRDGAQGHRIVRLVP